MCKTKRKKEKVQYLYVSYELDIFMSMSLERKYLLH